MKTKNCKLNIKEIDSDAGIVKGYFASFGTIDSDSDMFVPGAFSKSIQEHGADSDSNRKIRHLLFHDVTRPLDKTLLLKEDENGLYFESHLGTHSDGKDALRMYEEGVIKEHSVGFNYIGDKMEFVAGSKDVPEHYLLKEVKLWEGSAVTFGANSLTPNLTGVKSQEDLDKLKETVEERLEVFIKAIKDKNYQEKFNNLWEVEIRQLIELSKSLQTFEPSKDTLEEKSENDDDKKQFFINQLKL